jgi:outer membrane protein TolC
MGLDQAIPFDLATRSLAPLEFPLDSLEVYVGMALQNRPELAQLAAGVHARSSQASAAASDFWPQLFLGAQVKYNRAPNRFDPRNPFVYNPTNFFRPGVVLGFNWNLNFFQTRDRVRTARFEESMTAARAPLLEDGIRLEVQKVYLAVRHAGQDIRGSLKALQASDNWLRSEAQTFDLGISDVKDFIDAFRANGTMRAEHAESIVSFNTSLAALSKAVGRDLYPH